MHVCIDSIYSYISVCGGTITLPYYEFSTPVTSPGYPSDYANNLNCTWLITSPAAGDNIFIDLQSLEILDGDDELTVGTGQIAGQSSSWSSLNASAPMFLRVDGRYAWINFQSGPQSAYRGFALRLSAVADGGRAVVSL